MKAMKALIVVSHLALATSVYAGGFGPAPQGAPYPGADAEQPAPLPQPHAAGKTRAQVVAELREARANGELWSQEATQPPQAAAGPGKTRAQVVAELREARANGELWSQEATQPLRAAAGPGKTREQVVAELRQAREQGLVSFGDLDYPPAS